MKNTIRLITLLLLGCSHSQAEEFCVVNSFGLQAALNVAASNNQHDLIKIAEGLYITLGDEFSYVSLEGWDLEISGGWTEFMGNDCGQQLSGNPFFTTLDGDQANRVLYMRPSGSAEITISNLMIANGYVDDTVAAGFYFQGDNSGFTGDLLIERVVFMNNQAFVLGAASIAGGHKVVIRNSLILNNHAGSGHNFSVRVFDETYFTNNTVYFNSHDTAPGTDANSGVTISANEGSQALIANNLLWENDNHDLSLGGNGDHYLHNNNFHSITGISSTPLSEFHNTALPPRFEGGLFNFTPAANSPLVNAGREPCTICPIPVPFDDAWGMGLTDLEGNVRVSSSTIDIGAFESPHDRDLIFMNLFE